MKINNLLKIIFNRVDLIGIIKKIHRFRDFYNPDYPEFGPNFLKP